MLHILLLSIVFGDTLYLNFNMVLEIADGVLAEKRGYVGKYEQLINKDSKLMIKLNLPERRYLYSLRYYPNSPFPFEEETQMTTRGVEFTFKNLLPFADLTCNLDFSRREFYSNIYEEDKKYYLNAVLGIKRDLLGIDEYVVTRKFLFVQKSQDKLELETEERNFICEVLNIYQRIWCLQKILRLAPSVTLLDTMGLIVDEARSRGLISNWDYIMYKGDILAFRERIQDLQREYRDACEQFILKLKISSEYIVATDSVPLVMVDLYDVSRYIPYLQDSLNLEYKVVNHELLISKRVPKFPISLQVGFLGLGDMPIETFSGVRKERFFWSFSAEIPMDMGLANWKKLQKNYYRFQLEERHREREKELQQKVKKYKELIEFLRDESPHVCEIIKLLSLYKLTLSGGDVPPMKVWESYFGLFNIVEGYYRKLYDATVLCNEIKFFKLER